MDSKGIVKNLLLEEAVFGGDPFKYHQLRGLSYKHFANQAGTDSASESAWFQAVIEMLETSGYSVRAPHVGAPGNVIPFKVVKQGA